MLCTIDKNIVANAMKKVCMLPLRACGSLTLTLTVSVAVDTVILYFRSIRITCEKCNSITITR